MTLFSLMYHDVVEGGDYDASGFPGGDAAVYKLERTQFAGHLQSIAAQVSGPPVPNALNIVEAGHGFVLTFDDGGVSAFETARLLEEFDWRGHFFVTAKYIDQAAFLDRKQIKDLHRRGHVIGSHSFSHPHRISHCTRNEMLDEWRTSVNVLSEITGEQVRTASVPGGYFSREVAETAAAAGIRVLFTSEPTAMSYQVDGCLVVGRYTIQRRTPSAVAAAIAVGRIAPRLQQQVFWGAKKVMKRLGGELYLKVRKLILG
jgi:peptidoglycan/xylan/chitin deacetylase (PgdA/CDA1 family)